MMWLRSKQDLSAINDVFPPHRRLLHGLADEVTVGEHRHAKYNSRPQLLD